jgi:hypothetical protein
MVLATQRYEAATPDVVAEAIEGELLVVNLDTGVYFRGDCAATAAWEALTSGALPEQIGGRSQAEVRAYVDELLKHGLIRPRASNDDIENAAVSATLPDGKLTLERFDDLADMLALDPVHDVDAEQGWPTRK